MASAGNVGDSGPAGSSKAIPVAGANSGWAFGASGPPSGPSGPPHPPFLNVAKSPVDEARMSLGARPGGSVMSAGQQRDMSLSTSASCVLEDCRKELSNLRQLVKAATSHKVASLGLLADASEVMVKLEEMVYNTALAGSEREQLIHRVGHRLLLAMDRAEGVVRKFGHVSAMRKVFQSSQAAQGQFEDVKEEISKVSLVADAGGLASMKMMMSNSEAAPSSAGNGTGYVNGGVSMGQTSLGMSLDDEMSGLEQRGVQDGAREVTPMGLSMASLSAGGQSSMQAVADPGSAAQALPTDTCAPQAMGRAATLSGLQSRLSYNPPTARNAHSASMALSKTDGVSIVTDFTSLELFKGSKQAFLEAGASVELETTEEDEDNSTLGSFLWIYSTKILGPDRMTMLNTFDGSRQTIHNDRSCVTIMHYDSRGVLWTGHKSGQVTAWNVHNQKPYCKSAKVSSGQIKAITSDEAGTAWVGSDKGDVRRVALTEQLLDAEIIGYELIVTGQLKHSGSGTPDISASHPLDANGMVINLRAKEKAHNGPVTAILAAAGRVWTSGGSPAFVCLKEWTQRGEFMNKRDLKVTGAATSMKIVSPFVAVRAVSADQVVTPSNGSITTNQITCHTAALDVQFNSATGNRKTSHADIRQQYQVIMGYANGTIGVWGPINGILCQFIRIGRHLSPVTGIAVLDDLGMIASSHIDGKLRLRVPPRIVDKDRLSVAYSADSVYSVNLNLIELVASQAGDSIMGVYAHKNGMSYATATAKTIFVSSDTLADIIVQAGVKLLRGLGNKLSSCSPEWASKSMEESYSDDIRGDQESFSQMKSSMLFPQDAFQWMIDYADLSQTRVIGEGAFGKVYLGKWHETDVAIKALTSLGALGISAGQIASYATESDVKEALKTLEREVGLMVGMRHPNVILFLGVCPDPPCVVTEYCARGSLYDVLMEAKERPAGGLARALSWYRRVSMMLDAAKGMLYLHSHKPTIIHRDLKSPNLLVDGNWNVKVTDFNLSRLADVTQPGVASSVVANNPRWHAPEIIRDALFTKPGDVYAFGLIMWEMITWELPYDSMSSFQMMLVIGEKGGRPPVPDAATGVATEGGDRKWTVQGGLFHGYEAYIDLMVRCWDQNPESRPAFPEIISKLREILSTFSESDAEAFAATEPAEIVEHTESDAGINDGSRAPSATNGSLGVARSMSRVALPSPFDSASDQADESYHGGNAAMQAPPGPFHVSTAGPFSDASAGAFPASSQLPSVAPTILSPFDAATSGGIADGIPEGHRGDRRVVDSVSSQGN